MGRMMFVTIIVAVAMACSCNAAINPDPTIFSLPTAGIRSIVLSRNTTTVIAATYSQLYAVYSKTNGGPMNIISKSDYFSGDFGCLFGDYTSVGVVLSVFSNFSHPISYIKYRFNEPNGTFVVTSTLQFDLDNSNTVTCEADPVERMTSKTNQTSGYYIAAQSSLYFLGWWSPTQSSLERVGQLAGVQAVDSLTVIPGTNSTQYMPVNIIVAAAYPEDTTPVTQFALPTPAAATKSRSLGSDEIGVQYVNLYGGYSPDLPSSGWLITTLKGKAGLRLTPFDFGSFISGVPIVDTQTVYGAYPQKVLVHRVGSCVYVAGANPASTAAQPLVTLTQWYSSSATGTPQKIDQVVIKVISKSMNGIISLKAGWMDYVYAADDQNIYRFQSQCPDRL